MKHLALTLVLAAAASPLVAQGSQPPLIDRNLFYGEIAISGAQISPDGRSLSFLKPYKGTRNIWVKGVDEPFSAGNDPTMPALHCASTSLGVETMNIGAPMTGKRSRPRSISGMGIVALWRTLAYTSRRIGQ